ncbi:hypothetical protein [Agrobacterium sp. a22-2]|nr:hypothetical protein [Agrobacterium sp. a22-2]
MSWLLSCLEDLVNPPGDGVAGHTVIDEDSMGGYAMNMGPDLYLG